MDKPHEFGDLTSTTFGLYDPVSMGITLLNLTEMARAVEQETVQLRELANRLSPAKVQQAIREHRQKFEFYYRLRAHEKAHWLTSISSGITIARLMADGDTAFYLRYALREVLANTQLPIKLPLAKWVQVRECPRNLADEVVSYNANKLVNAAIDGMALDAYFLGGTKHILSVYFPDLKQLPKFWETPAYQVGARALIEGVGKAAEWLYFLRENSSLEGKAWQSIRQSPAIYRVALDHLMATLPHRSLLEYLQILVVVVDYALNPSFEASAWPFLWPKEKHHGLHPSSGFRRIIDAFRKQHGSSGQAEDVLPGFRFQRLLDLLRKHPKINARSKEKIASVLEAAARREYGWKTLDQSNKYLAQLVGQATVAGLNGVTPLIRDGSWNPLQSITMALQVKAADPLAYVPPVNAELINATHTYPPIEFTAGIDWFSKDRVSGESLIYIYALRIMIDKFQDDIVNIGKLHCPIGSSASLSEIWKISGWCPLGDYGCISRTKGSPDRQTLLRCDLYRSLMDDFFGDALDRIAFF